MDYGDLYLSDLKYSVFFFFLRLKQQAACSSGPQKVAQRHLHVSYAHESKTGGRIVPECMKENGLHEAAWLVLIF
jgi:hypothetical protein